MQLLKLVVKICKELFKKLQAGVVDGLKAQLNLKKHGGRIMLVTVLVESRNYGCSVNREMHVRRSI